MIEITPELAEICGIHAGDGYLRVRKGNKGEVDISGSFDEKEYYDNHVIPLFNKAFNLNLVGRYFSRKTYGFVCYRRGVREALLEMGFPSGKKSTTVQIPESILKSNNKSIQYKFLRGLFDTDGCLSFRKSHKTIHDFKNNFHHYPIVNLTTVSRKLAEEIIKVLHDIDINFYYRFVDPKKNNWNRAHIITINGINGLEKWMDLVGMKNEVKLTRYKIWKRFRFCPTNLTL